jgi:hypothetical protein
MHLIDATKGAQSAGAHKDEGSGQLYHYNPPDSSLCGE